MFRFLFCVNILVSSVITANLCFKISIDTIEIISTVITYFFAKGLI